MMVVPPVYRIWLATMSPQMAADLPACKAELARRVLNRPHGAFVDYMVDSPIAEDYRNFIDPDHYRRNVARIIEARVIEWLDASRANGGQLSVPEMRQ